ncbi:MAG: ABC transporter permease [Bacteroidetes bacterium]|nr:ABC transporter permease [Bacteroidota bacterium]
MAERWLFERLISKRMTSQAAASGRISRPIVRVAVGGIAVGLAVMLLALAVMNGFQGEIRKKVIGFGSHIQITGYDSNESLEADSLNRFQPSVEALKQQPNIRHIQVYATKAGLVKAGDQLSGVVLKGIDRDFDWSFFSQNLREGRLLSLPAQADSTSTEVLISRVIANKLKLNTGDKFRMYFLRENATRQRAFTVAGIYETGLTDGFDDRFILCDIRQVQKLNNWSRNAVAGFEVLVNDFNQLEATAEQVRTEIDVNLYAESIRELTPQIFSWLDVLDVNALIIIALMLFVSMINMISALLILILDRTQMIGILKAMGAADKQIMRVFLMHASRLIGWGILIGNVLGLGLCLLQKQFGIAKLDEASYYLSAVPIYIEWWQVLAVNAATFVLCQVALLLPALVVSRISPVKAIRFS